MTLNGEAHLEPESKVNSDPEPVPMPFYLFVCILVHILVIIVRVAAGRKEVLHRPAVARHVLWWK